MKPSWLALVGLPLALFAPHEVVACGFGTECGKGMGLTPESRGGGGDQRSYQDDRPSRDFAQIANELVGQGRYAEAEAYYRHALAQNPEALGYNRLGYCVLKQGRLSEALEYFLRAMKLDPHYPPAVYNYALTLEQLNRLAEALPYLRRATAMDSKYEQALAELERYLADRDAEVARRQEEARQEAITAAAREAEQQRRQEEARREATAAATARQAEQQRRQEEAASARKYPAIAAAPPSPSPQGPQKIIDGVSITLSERSEHFLDLVKAQLAKLPRSTREKMRGALSHFIAQHAITPLSEHGQLYWNINTETADDARDMFEVIERDLKEHGELPDPKEVADIDKFAFNVWHRILDETKAEAFSAIGSGSGRAGPQGRPSAVHGGVDIKLGGLY